jgi:hypothetical protein
VHLLDSPGYGDYINNTEAIETVRSHLATSHAAWVNMSAQQISELVSAFPFSTPSPARDLSF